MNIGAVLTSTAGSSGANKSQNGHAVKGGFSNLLGGVLHANTMNQQSNSLNESGSADVTGILTVLQAMDLKSLDFLSPEQISQLENMKELSIESLLDVLNISVEDFSKLLTSLQTELKQLNIPISVNVEESQDIEDVMQSILLSLQQVPPQEWSKLGNEKLQQFVEVAKALELAGSQKDLHMNDARKLLDMKELLQSLSEKVDQLVKQTKSSTHDWEQSLRKAFQNQQELTNTKDPKPTSQDNTTKAEVTSTSQKQVIPIAGNGMTSFVIPKTEQFSLVLKGQPQNGQYEQFVQQFSKILGKSQMTGLPNGTKLLIKLYPEQLGSLRVELLHQNGVLTAKILASTAGAKELLDSQLQSLKQAFASQNIQVEKIEVSQSLTEPSRQERGNNNQQPNKQGTEQHQQQEQQSDDDTAQEFKDVLLNIEV